MKRLIQALAGSPFVWGACTTAAFYWLVFSGMLQSDLVQRYFASHPVEYVITTMFFVGMVTLVRKLIDVCRQSTGMQRPLLEPIPAGGQSVEDCSRLMEQLVDAEDDVVPGYRTGRLRRAVEFVQRNGSAEGLNEELKYLAEDDIDELHAGYGLVRMIIWAIPILGFLGTVIGIALAMGNLNPEALSESMRIVMSGLTVAFDTTALALALSIVLYFSQFLTERQESQLLLRIDGLVEREMVGRFARVQSAGSGELAAVRRMLETVIESTEQLVRRQAAIWSETMEAAETRFAHLAEEGGRRLGETLNEAIQQGVQRHGETLAELERTTTAQNLASWQRIEQSLVEHTQSIGHLRQESAEQVQMLRRAIEAAGEIASLEDRLNENLGTLAGAGHFEQTLEGLSAAIHLLNSRLGQAANVTRVHLESESSSKGHAA